MQPIEVLPVLCEALFSDNEVVNNTPYSFTGPDFYPRKASRALGAFSLSLDPREDFIHTDIFPTHCEIWRIATYRDSNIKRARFKQHHEEQLKARIARDEVMVKLVAALCQRLTLPPAAVAELATQIYNNHNQKLLDDLGVQVTL